MDRIVLTQEAEFTLGELRVCPAKREVIAGQAREVLQPRIMQVLVALAHRRGEVVSRDELIAMCWGGYAVSDDAVQRCIARIRRLSQAYGSFRLETVPRVGYQLSEDCAATGLRAVAWRGRVLVAAAVAAGVLLVAVGFVGAHLL